MSTVTQSRWFVISVFLVSGFGTGFSIANSVYYWRIRSAGGCGDVSRGEANAMFWISIILSIVFLLMFIWSIWRLIFSERARKQISQAVTQTLQAPVSGTVKDVQQYIPTSASGSTKSQSASIQKRVKQSQVVV